MYGNLIRARHHTDHNKPWDHENPHDHDGTKDDKGNNTIIKGPKPVDEKFRGPDHSISEEDVYRAVGYTAGTIAVGYIVYQAVKWSIATLLAPATGGGSYVLAGMTP